MREADGEDTLKLAIIVLVSLEYDQRGTADQSGCRAQRVRETDGEGAFKLVIILLVLLEYDQRGSADQSGCRFQMVRETDGEDARKLAIILLVLLECDIELFMLVRTGSEPEPEPHPTKQNYALPQLSNTWRGPSCNQPQPSQNQSR